MILRDMLKQAERFAVNNSPAILTGIGVAGTVSTALLTGRASVRAYKIIEQAQVSVDASAAVTEEHDLTFQEKTRLVWIEFLPPVLTGTATAAAIVFANRIGMRRAAAMAAAVQLGERAFTDYREKVEEALGKNKEQALRDQVAQAQVDRNPPSDREVLMIGDGEVLFHDAFTDRYFKSSMEEVKHAINRCNYDLNQQGYVSLSDFYAQVGLATTDLSDGLGWTSDHLIDPTFSAVMTPDKRPAISVSFHYNMPQPNFDRFGR